MNVKPSLSTTYTKAIIYFPLVYPLNGIQVYYTTSLMHITILMGWSWWPKPMAFKVT
jgi:hypothetical protein